MSTVITGDDQGVFAALREGFARATEAGEVVMVVTVSNACPVPGPGRRTAASGAADAPEVPVGR